MRLRMRLAWPLSYGRVGRLWTWLSALPVVGRCLRWQAIRLIHRFALRYEIDPGDGIWRPLCR